MTENTRYNYNEYYVRSACEAVLTTARAIERENLRTTQRMQAKVKGLERAIETYMATEKKISGSKGFFNDFFKNFYNRFFKTSIKDSIGTTSWVLNTKSYSAGLGQKYGITSSTLRPQFAVGTGKDISAQSKLINGTAYMKPEALAKAIGANVSTVGMPPGTYWFSKDGTQKKIKAVDGLVPVKIVAEHFGVNMHGGSLVSNDTGKVMKNRTVISGSTWAQGTGENKSPSYNPNIVPCNPGQPAKPVVDLKGKAGVGGQAKVKVLGVKAELGFARYYEDMTTQTPRDTLEFNANIQITNKIFIGTTGKSSLVAGTNQQIPGSENAFLGIKVGNHKLGWGDIPNSGDITAETGLGGFTPLGGGEFSAEVNLSELYRRIKG